MTTTAETTQSRPPMDRRRLSARVKILGTYIALSGAALAISVALLQATLVARSHERTDTLILSRVNKLSERANAVAASTPQTIDADLQSLITQFRSEPLPGTFSFVLRNTRQITDVEGISPALIEAGFLDSSTAQALGKPGWSTTGQGRLSTRSLTTPIQVGRTVPISVVVGRFTDEESSFLRGAFADALRVALGSLIVATGLAWLVAGRVLRPVQRLTDSMAKLSERDLSNRIAIQGSSEFAGLIQVVNRSLDRVESSFVAQRRFLDDAGHELRTPITVSLGHLELAGTDPAELLATKPIVEEELLRMSRIVDDLLVIAISDQPDFIKLGPVDVDELVIGAVERARKLSGHRWVIDEAPPVMMLADSQRLMQALLNLIANAIRHTPAGQEIGVGARLDATTNAVRLWVRDTGEGIAPQDHEQVFERFRRGSTQRASGGSAGLGLSIVLSIAAAHQGRVELTSDLGSGAEFCLVIPAMINHSEDLELHEVQESASTVNSWRRS
jgi:two-component system, OmpR family, sensor kinase